ncbi:MAG: ATP-binding protein [Actinomycetaceae bacterium]|nr:ATP-binding protein [Actinomycetaceae bacterium]MDU0969901.1 ATP-binding protein [Actinomycetaceae bacterium]
MLRDFSVANFKSFYTSDDIRSADPMFTTVATREQLAGDTLARVKRRRIVPASALYGANASGKSTFVEALATLRTVVLSTRESAEGFPITPHLALGADQPTSFSVTCVVADPAGPGDLTFTYELVLTPTRVVEETLWRERSADDATVFDRRQEGDQARCEFWGPLDDDPVTHSVATSLGPNELLLTRLATRPVRGDNDPLAPVRAVLAWFERLTIIMPASRYLFLPYRFDLDKEFGKALCDHIATADTGIADIKLVEHSGRIPDEVDKEIRRAGVKAIITDTETGDLIAAYYEDGHRVVQALKTVHRADNGKEYLLPLSAESDGTVRLFDLLPAFIDSSYDDTPRVFVIDELDRSLHANLTVSLIEVFLRRTGPDSRHQLIFTTHELEIMRKTLLRRDEIWLVDKADGSTSTLARLSDFDTTRIRKNADLVRAYSSGRLGAIPRSA